MKGTRQHLPPVPFPPQRHITQHPPMHVSGRRWYFFVPLPSRMSNFGTQTVMQKQWNQMINEQTKAKTACFWQTTYSTNHRHTESSQWYSHSHPSSRGMARSNSKPCTSEASRELQSHLCYDLPPRGPWEWSPSARCTIDNLLPRRPKAGSWKSAGRTWPGDILGPSSCCTACRTWIPNRKNEEYYAWDVCSTMSTYQ